MILRGTSSAEAVCVCVCVCGHVGVCVCVILNHSSAFTSLYNFCNKAHF